MHGTIVAVCTSPQGGIPKYPHTRAVIGRWGFVGDFHNREMRRSFSKPGTMKPNTDRHLTLVAAEVLEELGRECLGNPLGPGMLAENITVRGLGDLSDVPDGAEVLIGSAVELRVVEQNSPCGNVRRAYGLEFYERVQGRRGLLCAIERGAGCIIVPDDPIETRW